jgi:hypothetical protein
LLVLNKLIKHFFRYINDLNPEYPDRITEISFIDIKNTLKRDLAIWENKAENSRENGKKGGRPINLKKPTITKQVNLEPKEPVNVIVKDNVIVSDNVNIVKYPSEQEFFNYARTLKTYSSNLDFAIQSKFLAWSENNWIDGNGKKIKNWKSTLINSIPYMKPHQEEKKGRITELMEQYNRFNNGQTN